MKIYTKTGDKGQTGLATGERVLKTDSRLMAYGTADELNSYIGWLRVLCNHHPEIENELDHIQCRLFDIGALLAGANIHIQHSDISRLEQAIDRMQAQLEPLRAFILPAGGETTCRCHICRTVTRRLEREILSIEQSIRPDMTDELIYINRLSDYLFVLSRFLGKESGDKVTIWQSNTKN